MDWSAVDYCDVFIRLSFWRHPFTAEHPLLCDTFLQIWSSSYICIISFIETCKRELTSHLYLCLCAQQTQVVVVVVQWESRMRVYLQCLVAFSLRRIRDTHGINHHDPVRLQLHVISAERDEHRDERHENPLHSASVVSYSLYEAVGGSDDPARADDGSSTHVFAPIV